MIISQRNNTFIKFINVYIYYHEKYLVFQATFTSNNQIAEDLR